MYIHKKSNLLKMKVIPFLIVLLLVVTSFRVSIDTNKPLVLAQANSEINFKELNLEGALKEAKRTNKLVFIDAYTVWCGPCKKMAMTSFKNSEVAAVFNEKFINIKIEVEKDADGPALASKYGIKAYPTLLFIDGDGKLVKSIVGFQNETQLLAIGQSF